jgi:quercetin dioxygenase-like cupin family protein
MRLQLVKLSLLLPFLLPSIHFAQAEEAAQVKPLLSRDLIGSPGKEVDLLTVEYPPGGSSGPHRHNAQTFVYVLAGHVTMQVRGGPEVTLGPGQTFYEGPDDVHVVSKNASQTEPAKFLVVFVKTKGAPAVVPAQ